MITFDTNAVTFDTVIVTWDGWWLQGHMQGRIDVRPHVSASISIEHGIQATVRFNGNTS